MAVIIFAMSACTKFMDCKEIFLDHNIILSLRRLSCSTLGKVLYKHVLASVNGRIRASNQRITFAETIYDKTVRNLLENKAFMEKSFKMGGILCTYEQLKL